MSKINDGGPAFAHGNHEQGGDSGMSKREYFDGQAMQEALTGLWANPDMSGVSPAMIANEAVQHADALIAELEKHGPAPHDIASGEIG